MTYFEAASIYNNYARDCDTFLLVKQRFRGGIGALEIDSEDISFLIRLGEEYFKYMNEKMHSQISIGDLDDYSEN